MVTFGPVSEPEIIGTNAIRRTCEVTFPMNFINVPVDKLGRNIEVGSIIAYGHALGRCAGLRVGKVLAIKSLEKHGYTGTFLEWRITVRGVDDDWQHRTPELCKRNGTLQFPNRMVVLDPATLPKHLYDLLMSWS